MTSHRGRYGPRAPVGHPGRLGLFASLPRPAGAGGLLAGRRAGTERLLART